MQQVTHFMYVPFTGLGKYNGFRGNRWLKNRLKIFKQFVIPSLLAQTNQNFVVWISWRPEERSNRIVKEFIDYCSTNVNLKFVNTFHGVCFYDDKYEDNVARERLMNSLHYSMAELHDSVGQSEYVLMTIQPSDDLYDKHAVETLQWMFANEDWQAIGFKKGYIINYWNKEVAEYNPTTNPPFYTIKFTRKDFLAQNPNDHLQYTALKKDVGKYKAGTPLPSHEYVGDCLKYTQIDERGFMVGTHLENISTTWQIPFKGEDVKGRSVLDNFGIKDVKPISMRVPVRKRFYFSLPYKAQRKLRYWLTEKFVLKNPLKKLSFWRNYTTNQHKNWWKNRKIDWRKDYLSTWNHPHRQALRSLLGQLNWFSLMEVGCGAGANLVQIALGLKGRRFQLGGTDINPDAIQVAETNGFFAGGNFLVCPNDDILMSDKSADILITDMNLIYTGPGHIDKTLQQLKLIARNWVVLSEFDSESWWERIKLRLGGYHAYDYKKLLDKNGFYDVKKYKYKPEHWPEDATHQKFASIIIAKVPEY